MAHGCAFAGDLNSLYVLSSDAALGFASRIHSITLSSGKMRAIDMTARVLQTALNAVSYPADP